MGQGRTPYVLIVEDDRDIAAFFRRVLDLAGYRTGIVTRYSQIMDILPVIAARIQRALDKRLPDGIHYRIEAVTCTDRGVNMDEVLAELRHATRLARPALMTSPC